MLKILTLPNQKLRQKGRQVTTVDKRIKKIIKEMVTVLEKSESPKGIGLSANQLGIDLRIILVKFGKIIVPFINPEITFTSKKTLKKVLKKEEQFFEGCLSVPQIYGFVDRPYQIKLEWQNEKGQKKSQSFKNRLAICLQHELDHLNGVLFIDRLLKQKGKIYELKKDKKGKDFFEEVEL